MQLLLTPRGPVIRGRSCCSWCSARHRRSPRNLGTGGAQTVNMFVQVGRDALPHRVKNEVDTFATGLLRGRDEICITSNQHYLIDLLLERQRRNVDADPHVHPFLLEVKRHVVGGDVVHGDASGDQILDLWRLDRPLREGRKVTQSERDLSLCPQALMQLQTKFGLRRFCEINCKPTDRIVHSLREWRAIVEENTIQLVPFLAPFRNSPSRSTGTGPGPSIAAIRRRQVLACPPMSKVRGALGVVCILGLDCSKSFDEIRPVNEDGCCCRHHGTFGFRPQNAKSPRVRHDA